MTSAARPLRALHVGTAEHSDLLKYLESLPPALRADLIPQPKRHAKPTAKGKTTIPVRDALDQTIREALPRETKAVRSQMAEQIILAAELAGGIHAEMEKRRAAQKGMEWRVRNLARTLKHLRTAVAWITESGDLEPIEEADGLGSLKDQLKDADATAGAWFLDASPYDPRADIAAIDRASGNLAKALDSAKVHFQRRRGARSKAPAKAYTATLLRQLRSFKVRGAFERRFVTLMIPAAGFAVTNIDNLIKEAEASVNP